MGYISSAKMTRKKKENEKKGNKDEVASSTEEVIETKEGELKNTNEEEEKQDIKLLEGEEQKVLEYHDLDDLIANYNKLKESNKKDKEVLLKYKKEADSWKNKHMRLQAEFENAQKRWNKNRQNLRTEYTGRTLKTFLPLYDSFKKALDGDDDNKVILKQFYDQFISILKFHKAEPIVIKINDIFDYSHHEALSSIEKDDLPNNSIIEIIQDGWKMDKDVIRYSKVIVSREPKPPEPEPEPESDADSEEKIAQENKEDKDDSIENEDGPLNETKENDIKTTETEDKNG